MKAWKLLFVLLLLVGFRLDAHATNAISAPFGVIALPMMRSPVPWQANSVPGGKNVKVHPGETLTFTGPGNAQTHWPINIVAYEGPEVGSSLPFVEVFIPYLQSGENFYSNFKFGPLFNSTDPVVITPTLGHNDFQFSPSVGINPSEVY